MEQELRERQAAFMKNDTVSDFLDSPKNTVSESLKNDTVSDLGGATATPESLQKYLDKLRGPILGFIKTADHWAPRAYRTAEDLSMALTAIMHCGGLLIKAKEKCLHGEFLPWLAQIGVNERRAQRYMDVYRHKQELSNEGNMLALSLRDALRLITEFKDVGEQKKRAGKRPTVKQFGALDVDVDGSLDDKYEIKLTVTQVLFRRFLRTCTAEETHMSQTLKLALLNYINRYDLTARAYAIGYEDAKAGREPADVRAELRDVESVRHTLELAESLPITSTETKGPLPARLVPPGPDCANSPESV